MKDALNSLLNEALTITSQYDDYFIQNKFHLCGLLFIKNYYRWKKYPKNINILTFSTKLLALLSSIIYGHELWVLTVAITIFWF